MKVAVIINENELQRFGHPNVIPYFEHLFRNEPHKYIFVPFTNVNINDLFASGKKGLFDYDSLYISTNACNDIDILTKLIEVKPLIEEYIHNGRGIFVGYQKKISISNDPATCFLPEIYNYDVVRKEIEYETWMQEHHSELLLKNGIPSDEKSSSSGHISVSVSNADDVILNYPRSIESNKIEERCKDEKNGFRAHVYRAVIRPKSLGAYDTLLCDDSYEDVRPLLCRCVSGNDERIVITTIALDWERHDDILFNIIKYITEGTPHIALVTDIANTDGDFRYLMSNMSLNKITHCVLTPTWLETVMSNNDVYLTKLIKCYVFSSSFSRSSVDKFWNKYKSNVAIKVYYFEKKQDDGDQVLMEYSNISSIDTKIQNVVLWINSHYSGGMFKGSFWTTVDTLMMFKKLNLHYEAFLSDVFKDIFDNHYYKERDGSYDGLIGCTVGLLELFINFRDDLRSIYPEIDNYIEKTLLWVLKKSKSVSMYEQLSVVNAIYRLELLSVLSQDQIAWIEEISEQICNSINNNNTLSESELCRSIELCIYRKKRFNALLLDLMKLQDEYGSWVSIGRTSNVINFLVSKFDLLADNIDDDTKSKLQACIEMGVVYLSEEFNEKNASWNEDFLSTVKAALAIGSYNNTFKYATKDFSETIREQSTVLTRCELTSYAIETISKQRIQINEMSNRFSIEQSKLKEKNSKLIEEQEISNIALEKNTNEIAYLNNRIKNHGKIIATLSCVCLALIVIILLRINAYRDIFLKIVSFFDIKDIITNSVSSLVLLVIGGIGAYFMLKFTKGRSK